MTIKWTTRLTFLAISACLLMPQAAEAQRGNGRGNRGNNRNNGNPSIGDALEYRLRGEVNNALGLPYNTGQSNNFNRGRGSDNFGNPRRSNQWGNNNRGNYIDQRGYNGRSGYGYDGYRYNNDRSRNGYYSGNYGRYQSNPLASVILQQFPGASRLLLPRGRGNTGAFYRNDDRYYYYPNVYNSYPAAVQSSTTYIQPSQAVGVGAPPQSQPVPVQFGGYAYVAELSPVLPVVINDLCLDMHYNYQGPANHAEAYRNAYAMLTASKAVPQSHEAGDREGVKRNLQEVDRLMHLLEEQTDGWQRNHRKQVGELGLLTKMEIASDMTHHLLYDVGVSTSNHPEPASTTPETGIEPTRSPRN